MKNIKRLLCVCLIACICFCVVGCKNDIDAIFSKNGINSEINQVKTTFDVGTEKAGLPIECFYQTAKLTDIKNIVDSYLNYFITADGSLYQIGKFSNGDNIRKCKTEIKFVKFFPNAFEIISQENKVYGINTDNFTVKESAHYDFYGDENFKYYAMRSEEYGDIEFYLEVKDVYICYDLNYFQDKGEKYITKKIHSFGDDEEIEYIIDGNIKTNKNFYYFEEKANYSEYDDIPTTYDHSLKKLPISTENFIFAKYHDGRLHLVDVNNTLYYLS